MRRILSMLAVVMTLGLSTAALDAEAAKRLGSGKSVGTQRQVTQDKAPAATAQPATAGAAAAAGAGAPAAAGRSWMAPVAGLAAGLGIAALASHLGFGGELASMVMMGLLAAAVVAVVAFVMRRRAAASSSGAAGPQFAYAGAGAGSDAGSGTQVPWNAPVQTTTATQPLAAGAGTVIGSALGAASSGSGRIPAGFDTASFERHASENFVRLQAANDAGDLKEIGRFTTPELLEVIRQDMAQRDGAPQKTVVTSVAAQVIDVEESADGYIVSVRLSGMIREAEGAADETFAEIWHLSKPRVGGSGWLLAGIQQVQ